MKNIKSISQKRTNKNENKKIEEEIDNGKRSI